MENGGRKAGVVIPESDGMIRYIGKIGRKEVNELYGKCRAGLLLYQPAHNHFEAQPIKMFEYMAAGLPLIASDYPLWRYIVKGKKCGLCVDGTKTGEVKKAIRFLLNNFEQAQQMGRNGRNAVERYYNWGKEQEKLLQLYKRI